MRRIDVVCQTCGTKEEITIGSFEEIPACSVLDGPGRVLDGDNYICGGEREIYWDDKGPGFRIKGLTKRF